MDKVRGRRFNQSCAVPTLDCLGQGLAGFAAAEVAGMPIQFGSLPPTVCNTMFF